MATVAERSTVTETCPGCSTKAPRVAPLTVQSLVKPELADQVRQGPYRFCPSPACDVVYFNDTSPENRFVRSDLRVRVGKKETGPPIPVCYCFDWTAEDIEREFRLTGTTSIPDRVKQKIQQGLCRCETMNPQGICCLGEVNKAAKEIRARLAAPSGETKKELHGNGEESATGIASIVRPETGQTKEKGAWLATLGATFTAILGSACCWLPLLLIAFGFSVAGVGSFFEQYRPLLLTITFALLGAAWCWTYRTSLAWAWARLTGRAVPVPAIEACCVGEAPAAAAHSGCAAELVVAPEGCCVRQTQAVAGRHVRGWFTLRRSNEVMLWIATVVILLFAFFPHWVGFVLGGGGARPAATINGAARQQVVLDLQGMTCEGCAAAVEQALRKVPGVADAEVRYARAEAVVQVEPESGVSAEVLVRAVEGAGYKARLKRE